MDTTQSLECGDDHLFPRSDLKYQVHERGDGACGFILEVSFAGKYRPGAAGRPDAELMTQRFRIDLGGFCADEYTRRVAAVDLLTG